MTDFDVLARIRKLESECGLLKDRLAGLERAAKRYHDAPAYNQNLDYSPTMEECYGAMVHAMKPRDERKD